MKNLIIFAFSLLSIYACAPKTTRLHQQQRNAEMEALLTNKRQLYISRLDAGSQAVNAGYYYSLELTKEGKYLLKTYNPDLELMTHFVTYSDKDLKIKHGTYREWWDNGIIKDDGFFENGVKKGVWKEGNFSGGYSQGSFKGDLREGVWINKDSLEMKTSEHTYLNGKLHGIYKLWNKQGKLKEEGNYNQDKLESRKNYEEELSAGAFIKVERIPYFKGDCSPDLENEALLKCGGTSLLKFLASNIKYPAFASEWGIEGRAIFQFVIDKEGNVINVVSMRGVCKEIKAEGERVVKLMPKWSPGMQNGKMVKVYFTLPINFKLD